jgi:hypothetical protein
MILVRNGVRRRLCARCRLVDHVNMLIDSKNLSNTPTSSRLILVKPHIKAGAVQL